MKVRSDLEFYTTLPDDCIEADGEIIQFPGLGVTEAISDLLTTRGYVVSEPYNADFIGWELIADRGKQGYWIRIARLYEDCRLYTTPTKNILWPFSKREPYEQFLRDLHEVMSHDDRFNRMAWIEPDSRGNTITTGPTPFKD
jgi:hypothetical protein